MMKEPPASLLSPFALTQDELNLEDILRIEVIETMLFENDFDIGDLTRKLIKIKKLCEGEFP